MKFAQPQVPFEFSLEGSEEVLYCYSILRLVPGKRLVAFATWGDREVVVKLFFDRFKAKSHAKREVQGSNALSDAKIPTPELLYFGTGVDRDHSIFAVVYERLNPIKDLNDVFEVADGAEEQFDLLRSIALMLARQHENGLYHRDIHPDNFILTDNGLFVIDTSSIDISLSRQSLDKRLSLKNLGQLFAQINPKLDSLCKDIFAIYAKARRWIISTSHVSPDASRGALIKWQQYYRLKRERMKLRKIFRNATHFIQKKSFSRFMVCDKSKYTESMRLFLDNPDQFIANAEILKKGNTCTVAKIRLGGRVYVVKRYNIKNIFHRIKLLFKRTRAAIYWCNAHRLMLNHIAVPEPVALLEERFGPFRGRAFYLSEYVDGMHAKEYFTPARLDNSEARYLAKNIVEIVFLMHRLGISHGDLKASNFIISGNMIYLIDLDSMKRHHFYCHYRDAVLEDQKRFMQNWHADPAVKSLFLSIFEKMRENSIV